MVYSSTAWTRQALLLSLVGTAILSIPCEARGIQTHPDAAVSDSSGVRIVEWPYPDTTGGPTWELADEPLIEVGGPTAAGPYALERVGPMLRTEGGVVLAAAGTTELRFFDDQGQYVRTVTGDEATGVRFTAIRGLDQLADGRTMAFDLAHGVVIIDSDGQVVETHGTGRLWFPALLANGTAVGTSGPIADPVAVDAGLIRTRETLRLLDLRSGEISDLVSLPGLMWYRSTDGRQRYPPWAPRPNYQASSNRIIAAWSGEPSVKVFDEEGRLTEIVRWRQGTELVTPSEIENLVSSVEEERREAIRDVLTRELFVRQIISGINLDEEGNLWVRPESMGGAPVQRHLMFALDGTTTGYMELPSGVRVASISQHEFAGLWFVDGRPVARVYEVRKVGNR